MLKTHQLLISHEKVLAINKISSVKHQNVLWQRLPISLDKMFLVKIILLLLNEDREKRTTHVSDFNSDLAITPNSALERFRLFKDLLLVHLVVKANFAMFLRRFFMLTL